MARTGSWKVYSDDGEYLACTFNPFHAAMIIAGMGEGEIRYGHTKKRTCWKEGHEAIPASESYDTVAETCYQRAGLTKEGRT